jgi:penicillin-binding protein 1A
MVEKDISPCKVFDDIPYTISKGEGDFILQESWTPDNATETFTTNLYNLYHGILYSKNSITVRLLKEIGSVKPLRNLLHQVGISKEEKLASGRLAVPEVPAIALGAVDISLLQLTGAYTTFSNNGTYQEPIFVTNILDRNGREIYRAKPIVNKAIDPLHNAVMVDMLTNTTKRDFSMGLKSIVGGKTGTTNDFVDGWYLGITPSLVVGTWTGGDENFIRFTTLDVGQGFITARPVFQKFIQKLETDKRGIFNPKAKFPTPPAGFAALTACDKYKTIPPEEERKLRKEQREKRLAEEAAKKNSLLLPTDQNTAPK